MCLSPLICLCWVDLQTLVLPGTLRSGEHFFSSLQNLLLQAEVRALPFQGIRSYLEIPGLQQLISPEEGAVGGGLRDGGIRLGFLAPQCPLRPVLEGKERG